MVNHYWRRLQIQQAARLSADGLCKGACPHPFAYGLTLIRSLIMSNVSLGTTFLATSSPFTLYGRLLTIRSATSLGNPNSSTISLDDARLTFMMLPGAGVPFGGREVDGAGAIVGGTDAEAGGAGCIDGARDPPAERD